MKKIQKMINDLLSPQDIHEYKAQKMADTEYFLEQQRRQYVATVPESFKARSSSDFFLQ